MPTPRQRLASLLLGQDVLTFIRDKRSGEGLSWPAVAVALADATNGEVAVTHQALQQWLAADDTEPERATA